MRKPKPTGRIINFPPLNGMRVRCRGYSGGYHWVEALEEWPPGEAGKETSVGCVFVWRAANVALDEAVTGVEVT